MNRILLAFILLLSFSSRQMWAQNEANFWYFGYNAGLDFSSGSPVVTPGGQTLAVEGTACMSDAAGNLRFYTDGVTVWNRLHQVMTNGTGLLGHFSTAQTLIVPNPGNPNLYYIFTADYQGGPNGLRYSVVNMTMSGGLGAVTSKNNFLATPVTEKITAARHQNHVDYWVVAHGWNNNFFYSYRVTATGVNPVPVVSPVGAVHNSTAIGWMHISPNGRKLALAIMDSIVQVFDFNRSTGAVSNPITLEPSGSPFQYGVEFNMDGNLLYVSTVSNRRVFQYNLNAGSQAAIQGSEVMIGMTIAPSAGALQMGPDGRIYMAKWSSASIAAIPNPDVPGTGCGFIDNAVGLAGATSWLGLPNYYNAIYYVPHVTSDYYCLGDSTAFFLNNRADVDSVLWNFDDPLSGTGNTSKLWDPKHVFTATGTFNVTALIHCGPYSSTLTHTVVIKGPPVVDLGNDTILCAGTSITISAVNPESSYLWQDGSTDSTFQATSGGVYWVTATNSCGSDVDSIILTPVTPPVVELGNDTSICIGDVIPLDASYPNSTYIWSNGASDSIIYVSNAGTYSVAVGNVCGLTMDSISVSTITAPVFSLGPDVELCPGQSVLLDATYPDAAYLWQDGSTQPTLATIASGTYWVIVTNVCGSTSDTVEVIPLSAPSVNLGPDTTICQGDLLQLDAFYPGASYLWHDGSTGSAHTASAAGTYWVRVSNQCGSITDSLVVQNITVPIVDLGQDTGLCAGSSMTLSAVYPSSTYLWEDGSLQSTHVATAGSTYWVAVTNVCGTTTDTIHIAQLLPPSVSLGNDTTICQGEQVTLDAQQPFSTYLWSTGATTLSIIASAAGTYSVVVTNSCGSVSDSVTLTVMQPPTVNLGSDQTICAGTTTTLIPAFTGASSLLWHDGSTGSTMTTGSAGVHWLIVSNMCGSATDSVAISVFLLPVTDLGPDRDICSMDTLTLDATGSNVQSYLWDDGSQSPSRLITQAGSYSVTVSNACGSDTDVVVITERTPPQVNLGYDTILCWGETLFLDANQANVSYAWSTGSTQAAIQVTQPGTYGVTLTDDIGCDAEDQIRVDYHCDALIQVPTGFSPNAEPPNDAFMVYGNEPPSFHIRIYNRWGEMIFESDDFHFQWYGDADGHHQPIGTYVYVIRYTDFDGTDKQLQGNVTLIR